MKKSRRREDRACTLSRILSDSLGTVEVDVWRDTPTDEVHIVSLPKCPVCGEGAVEVCFEKGRVVGTCSECDMIIKRRRR